MMEQDRHWIISGATGFIGREFVRRLLLTGKDTMTLIVRDSADGRVAAERVAALLESIGIYRAERRARVATLRGDMHEPRLGIDAAQREQLLERRSTVIHLAASTCFSESLPRARNSNVDGTRRMMALARLLRDEGKLERFVHVSTAYVAADRTDLVGADELDLEAGFRNAYERSKAEAERLVRDAMAELPCVIFRPSIVVGNSLTGEAEGANNIYWGLKQYARGRYHLFGCADATLDIVPVDYVVDAMLAILGRDDAHGRCFPLVAGPRKQIRLDEFGARVGAYLGLPTPRFLSPRLLDPLDIAAVSYVIERLLRLTRQQRFFRHMRSYLPYMSSNPTFDDSVTRDALRATGIEAPALPDYLPRLLRYCVYRGWARPPVPTKRGAVSEQIYVKLSRILRRLPSGPASA